MKKKLLKFTKIAFWFKENSLSVNITAIIFFYRSFEKRYINLEEPLPYIKVGNISID